MLHLVPFERNSKGLFDYLDDMEKNFFGNLDSHVSQFRVDIVDKGNQYVLEAELPGFAKEDIAIDLNENYLTISAQHKEEIEHKEGEFVRRERKYGSFSRSFDITGIETASIEASYKNGILSLTLPKEQPMPLPTRQIEIK